MPPPSNVSALTADTVTSETDVTVDVTGLAAPFATWYRYLVRDDERLISAWARPDGISGTNNNVRFAIYLGPAAAPVAYNYFGDSDLNKPKMIPLSSTLPTMTELPAGTEIFFEAYWNGATSPNKSLKFTVYGEEQNTIPAEAIIISSDQSPFPLIGLGWDGTIYGFIHHSSGEGGTILLGGRNAHTNDETGDLDIYGPTHSLVTSLNLSQSVAANTCIVSSDRSSTFYVNFPGVAPYVASPGLVYVVSDVGVLLDTITFSGVGIFKHAPNWDNTILYLSSDNLTVRRWDLPGAAFLSDLYTVPANHIIKNDILVMEDNSIMVPIRQTISPFAESIVHLDTAGATINTISLPGGIAGIGTFLFNRMCNSYDGDKIVVWLRDASILDRFIEYNQDGTVERTAPDFEQFDINGNSDTVTASDSMAHFGPSNSCPVMVATVEWTTDGPGPDPITGGLYFVSTRPRNVPITDDSVLKHDVYYETTKKIPNPTIRTALLGD